MKSNLSWTAKELRGDIDSNSKAETVEKKNRWHKLFESPRWILMNPAEEVINFYFDYLHNPSLQVLNRRKLDVKKIHDLGCGGGGHVAYFAELGYDVTGSDISSNALEFAQKELDVRGLKAQLVHSPMTKLPFKDGEFDATLSRAVIYHASLQDLKKIIFEIARTTKSGGLFFATFVSERSSEWKVGEEVLEDTSYIPTEGAEIGMIHTYLSPSEIGALVEPFFIIEELYLHEHPPLISDAPGANQDYFSSEYVLIATRR